MQKQVIGLLAAALLATAANAVPIVTINGGLDAVDLTPGAQATITIGVRPDANGVSAFDLVFDISDSASVALVSCTVLTADLASCAPGASAFGVLAAFNISIANDFSALSFVVDVPANATPGASITLRAGSLISDDSLNAVALSAQTIGRVVAVPEPTIASLLVLAGLARLGRKRSA